jgi:hypothetical protein
MLVDNWREKSLQYHEEYKKGLSGKTVAMMERARAQNKKPE